MAQARGSQLTVALYEESTYGADPGAPAGKKVYVKQSTGGGSQSLLVPDTLNANRTRAQPERGNLNVALALPVELSAENHGTLLKHAFGAVSSSGAGPYTHTLTIGALPVGLVIERDFGANISGSGRYEKFNGCRVGSVDIEIPQQGYLGGTFNLIGAGHALAASPLDASLEDTGHTPFSAGSNINSVLEGGSPIATIKSAKFSLNNDLDEEGFTLNPAAPGTRTELAEGLATVTGEIVAVFNSAALLTKAVTGTASSLKFIFSRGSGTGATGNEYFELEAANLVYERRSPEVSGPKGVAITLAFRGYGANSLRAIVKNNVATV